MRRYIRVLEGPQRYGGKHSAWRKWILNGSLGEAVVRLGRVVVLDTVILDQRLATTHQLLVQPGDGGKRNTSPCQEGV